MPHWLAESLNLVDFAKTIQGVKIVGDVFHAIKDFIQQHILNRILIHKT